MKKINITFSLNLTEKVYSTSLIVKLNGVLMGLLPPAYAEYLHYQSVNPYSLHVFNSKGNFIWEINLLDKQAAEIIGDILLDESFTEFIIESLNDARCIILEKKVEKLSEKDLADIFYRSEPVNRFALNFHSPTSFKQQGAHVFYPDLRLVFQSLMMKYNALMEDDNDINHDFLDEIVSSINITSYDLNSHYFTIHKAKIPAFRGKLFFTVRANNTVTNYIHVLLKFAEYSGVGVKTSLGMGNVSVIER